MSDSHEYAPIVPARQGHAPAFVVSCVDCGFSHDAHGDTAEDAISSVAPTHHAGHRLIAWTTDYATHPLYR